MVITIREDAWSHTDEIVLAERVLFHIRNGSTQIKAFEEAGESLSRTAAACGYRWNTEVKKRYKSSLEIARRDRRAHKREVRQQAPELPKEAQETTLKQVIAQLKIIDNKQSEPGQLLEENRRLKEQVAKLTEQLDKVEKLTREWSLKV